MRDLCAIVVDDEELARNYLVSILSTFGGLKVVAQCANGREAIKAVSLHEPDILFLDIEMPGMNGFDVVKALQPDVLPMVVFATAYEAYAVEAFDLQAVDYILKPFEPARVERAVERARSAYIRTSVGNKNSLIAAIDKIAGDDHKAETPVFTREIGKLAIKESGNTVLVPFDDIEWIDAAGDYMCVHVGRKTHVLRCTMKELEQRLIKASLVRVHRSTLANLDKVQSISSLPKGECQLHLGDDIVLKVSRSYRKSVEHLIS